MRIRGHLVDACIGLLLTAALLLPVELLLAGLGVGTPPPAAELSRGFDASAQYIVPDPALPGGFRTGFGKVHERMIPPKSRRLRVVLFGGSNTEGFPAGVLAERLEQEAPGVGWEVVNLGRSGYGSERVAIIFEQALRWIDPDVVVIYAGHNEFVERGFRMDLGEDGWLASATRLASRSRTVNLLAEALRREEPVTTAAPEEFHWEYQKFLEIPYTETLRYLDAYGANLQRMCRAAVDAGVGVVLSTSIYNRFSSPFASSPPPDMTAADRLRLEAVLSEAAALLPDYFAALVPTEDQRVYNFHWTSAKQLPKPLPPKAAVPGRRPGLGALAGRDPKLGEPWGWSRNVFFLHRALGRLHAHDHSDEERAGLERAATLLREALALAPDHPRAHFELGLVEYALGGEPAEIAARLEDAARYDRAPRKASAAENERVHAVAAAIPEVLLFDADALFAERVPMGLMGWEWMSDNCHISLGTAEVLMEDLARTIAERWGRR